MANRGGRGVCGSNRETKAIVRAILQSENVHAVDRTLTPSAVLNFLVGGGFDHAVGVWLLHFVEVPDLSL